MGRRADGADFDSQNHWLVDRGDGRPSLNVVVLSFVAPLKLLHLTAVQDYANAMVPARQPSAGVAVDNWQAHVDGKPTYARPVPPLAQRVALPDRGDPSERALHQGVEDVSLHQRPGRAGAHLALVERVQHQALALPISAPGPFTTLITPGGTTSSITSSSLRIDQGVGEAGFKTEQFAAANAGAGFQAAMSSGKLNGMSWPTTPNGCAGNSPQPDAA